MLKAIRCRRCGSTKAGHTCASARSAATKASKRMHDDLFGSDGSDSDHPVVLCSDDDDSDVFVKPKAKKLRASSLLRRWLVVHRPRSCARTARTHRARTYRARARRRHRRPHHDCPV